MGKKLNILSVDCDWIKSLRHQEDLLSFLIPLLFTHKEIILAYTHDHIYSHFTHGYDEYNLYNIDHHHDYSYENSAGFNPEQPTTLTSVYEGNWLSHLAIIFNKKINYTWIGNSNSEHIKERNYENARKYLKSYKFEHSLTSIPDIVFDKIFICCSPQHNIEEGIIAYKIIERIMNDK